METKSQVCSVSDHGEQCITNSAGDPIIKAHGPLICVQNLENHISLRIFIRFTLFLFLSETDKYSQRYLIFKILHQICGPCALSDNQPYLKKCSEKTFLENVNSILPEKMLGFFFPRKCELDSHFPIWKPNFKFQVYPGICVITIVYRQTDRQTDRRTPPSVDQPVPQMDYRPFR